MTQKMEGIHIFCKFKIFFNDKYFDDSDIYLKIEKVSNDNYIIFILWKIQSNNKDTSVLENLIEFSGSRDDFNLDISLESYEKMNKPTSD